MHGQSLLNTYVKTSPRIREDLLRSSLSTISPVPLLMYYNIVRS